MALSYFSSRKSPIFAIGTLILAGCGTSRPTRYFTLEPPSFSHFNSNTTGSSRSGLVVGIAPVQIAPYLDREELVTRTDSFEVAINDFHAWAEPLETSLPRAIAIGLEEHPEIRAAVLVPTFRDLHSDKVVVIEVFRFDGRLGGDVHLVARFFVFGGDANLSDSWANLNTQTADASFESLVRAMHELVAELAANIAEVVTQPAVAPTS